MKTRFLTETSPTLSYPSRKLIVSRTCLNCKYSAFFWFWFFKSYVLQHKTKNKYIRFFGYFCIKNMETIPSANIEHRTEIQGLYELINELNRLNKNINKIKRKRVKRFGACFEFI